MFVVNGAAHRANITTNAVALLSQHGPVSPVIVHHRQDFAYAMIDGETVQELYPKSKSAAEIVALWEYVKQMLSQKRKTR